MTLSTPRDLAPGDAAHQPSSQAMSQPAVSPERTTDHV